MRDTRLTDEAARPPPQAAARWRGRLATGLLQVPGSIAPLAPLERLQPHSAAAWGESGPVHGTSVSTQHPRAGAGAKEQETRGRDVPDRPCQPGQRAN